MILYSITVHFIRHLGHAHTVTEPMNSSLPTPTWSDTAQQTATAHKMPCSARFIRYP